MNRKLAALALLLLLSPIVASATDVQLFRGKVGEERLDVVIVNRGGEVLGATYRPQQNPSPSWDQPVTAVRLLTGTRAGDQLTLQEWSKAGEEYATITATMSGNALQGTWRTRAGNRALILQADPKWQSPLMNSSLNSWPPLDRLHEAIRAGRWADATFEARLACVLPSNWKEGCIWLDALPALSKGEDPPATPPSPWSGLLLERKGLLKDAIAADRTACEQFGSRVACGLLVDLLAHVDAADRQTTLHKTCSQQRIGCEGAWGASSVALVDAARRGDTAEVRRLLAEPEVNVNAGEGYLLTPLQAAVVARSLPVVKLLLQHGADPNNPAQKTGSGIHMPIDHAIVNDMDDIVLTLLDHGAKANLGDRVLWEAVYRRKGAIVRKILENGEDPDADPVPAGSPLMAAVKNRDGELVTLLLQHGADPDFSTNHSGGSPISLARETHQQRVLKQLLAARKPENEHH
jgi:ankyrin repeat protein